MYLLADVLRLPSRLGTVGGWAVRLVVLACCVSAASPARSQDEPGSVEVNIPGGRLQFGGALQPRVSYGVADGGEAERVGFGVRRARFRAIAYFGSTYGARYDVDLASGRLASIDLYAFYEPTPSLRFRAGYLPGAQPRAYVFTFMTRIDAVDRPVIADTWVANTIGARGRDFGLSTRYRMGGATAELFLHNGGGSFDRAEGDFRETVLGFEDGPTFRDLAASAYINLAPAAVPGFEVGGFAGYNGSRNPNTAPDGTDLGRRYLSYSGHLYWGADPGSQPLRLKADIIGIRFESIRREGVRRDAQHMIGGSVLGAARVLGHGEVFARYERLYADLDRVEGDYVTAGLSYSLSARRGLGYWRERVTLAYTNALPDEGNAVHLVVLQLQFAF